MGRRIIPCQTQTGISSWMLILVAVVLSAFQVAVPSADAAEAVNNNNNIHAVIVSSSRYWFNYRHAINALGLYRLLRSNGIPDSNIILMMADEYGINARNPYKNRMHATGIHKESWYNHTVELDVRGSDVTVQNFVDALLGTAPKALRSNQDSKVLVYVTGHGGDQVRKNTYLCSICCVDE
jgi:GPI-anchor transamidase subunit K